RHTRFSRDWSSDVSLPIFSGQSGFRQACANIGGKIEIVNGLGKAAMAAIGQSNNGHDALLWFLSGDLYQRSHGCRHPRYKPRAGSAASFTEKNPATMPGLYEGRFALCRLGLSILPGLALDRNKC